MTKVAVFPVTAEQVEPYVDFPMDPTKERKVFVGLAFSDHANATLVFTAGIEEVAPGVGEVWIKFNKPAKDYPAAWMSIKSVFQNVIDTGDYHRLQSHVLARSVSVGFNLHLGMKIEGVMRKYVDKKDYYIMGRVL